MSSSSILLATMTLNVYLMCASRRKNDDYLAMSLKPARTWPEFDNHNKATAVKNKIFVRSSDDWCQIMWADYIVHVHVSMNDYGSWTNLILTWIEQRLFTIPTFHRLSERYKNRIRIAAINTVRKALWRSLVVQQSKSRT